MVDGAITPWTIPAEWQDGYRAACLAAVQELRVNPDSSRFKQAPAFRAVVGNDCRGRDVVSRLYSYLVDRYGLDAMYLRSQTIANDRFGGPVMHDIEGAWFSAGALRYLQVAMLFRDAPSIVEIGGGYGGQRVACYAIEASPVKQKYAIFDIPEALQLAKVYCAVVCAPVTLVEAGSAFEVPPGSHAISDFALTELSEQAFAWYCEHVLSRCLTARITGVFAPWQLTLLRSVFASVHVEPEHPAMTAHPNEVATCRKS